MPNSKDIDTHADMPRTHLVDVVRIDVEAFWPVGKYKLSEDQTRILRIDGGGATAVRFPSQIREPLASLRKASPAQILDWVSRNGFVGAAPEIAPLDLHAQQAEKIELVRYAIRQLEACRRLLAAVRAGESAHCLRLRRKTLDPRPWRQDARHDRTAAHEIGAVELIDLPQRRTLPADFGALHAVADEVSFWVERTTSIRVRPRATRYFIRSTPEILAKGPLGWAFLELYEELSQLPISRRKEGARLIWSDRLVVCPICRLRFRRLRPSQVFDTKQCRWIANKREQRKREAGR